MSGSKIGQTNTVDRQIFFSDDSFLPETVSIFDHHTKYIQNEQGGSNELWLNLLKMTTHRE